jgi:uncharacterized membrane protein YqhA
MIRNRLVEEKAMKSILEKSVYLALIAVIFALIASAAMYIWGAVVTVTSINDLLSSDVKDASVTIPFVKIMDIFLIATALLFFAVALYELFIGDLELPNWLTVTSIDGLKTRLASVIVLILAVTFTEHFIDWEEDSLTTLYLGAAAAIVIGALVAYNRFGAEH